MSYLVLARKYRPKNFDDIIGQEHVTRTLKNAIIKDKLHHAFLFTGTRGVGKTTTARVLAKALCCQEHDLPTDEPCGKCSACLSIAQGNAVDVNEIDGASNNSVNDIRDLRENVQYTPQTLRYKIYIIDEVHMLTGAAFNALLKTLEEPPDHVKFIFATTESHKIPQTILSRCQRYDFKAVSAIEIATHMKKLCDSEGMEIDEAALKTLSRMARGSVRDGLSILDSVLAYASEKVEDEDVRIVLGIADTALFQRVTKALVERDGAEAFSVIADLVDYGHDLRQFGTDFLEYLRDCVLIATDPRSAKSINRTDTEIAELLEIAKQAEVSEWIAWFDLMVEGQERVAKSEQARYMFELTLAKMLQIGKLRSVDELLKGLGKVARTIAKAPVASGKVITADFSNDSKDLPVEKVPGSWKELVERIKLESRSLWGALMSVGVSDWGKDKIVLECPDIKRCWDQVGSANGKKELQTIASKILQRDIEIEIIKVDADKIKKSTSIANEDKYNKKQWYAEKTEAGKNDPTVMAVREVFGGGDVNVRPLKPKTK